MRILLKMCPSEFRLKYVHENFVGNVSHQNFVQNFPLEFRPKFSVGISSKICPSKFHWIFVRKPDEIPTKFLFYDKMRPTIFIVRNSSEMAFPTDLHRNHP